MEFSYVISEIVGPSREPWLIPGENLTERNAGSFSRCSTRTERGAEIEPKGPVIFIAWGLGGGGFRGDHLILGEQKGGSVVTENAKWGIAENFGRIKGGPLKFCWKIKTYMGDRESHQKLLGESLQ